MSKVLILGSSGQIGTELSKQLSNLGVEVLKATSQAPQQKDQVQVNIATQAGLDEAFSQVTHAFLLSPPGFANQDQLLIPAIEAAQKHKLQKVVLMTALGADADPSIPFRKAELALEASGLDYNIIRPNWFHNNFHTFWIQGIKSANKIFLPVGNAKGSFIDVRDIATAACRLLTTDTFTNQAFNLTGPESLDHFQIAEILSKVAGKEITYQEIEPEEMRHGFLSAGVPGDYTEFLLTILSFFKSGYSAHTTPDLERITGSKGIPFQQYAEDFAEHWRQ